jgi:hypothetical protein
MIIEKQLVSTESLLNILDKVNPSALSSLPAPPSVGSGAGRQGLTLSVSSSVFSKEEDRGAVEGSIEDYINPAMDRWAKESTLAGKMPM